MRLTKIRQGSWWWLGELCEVSRCLILRGLKHHYPRYNVSCIFFICVPIFYITWIDTLWIDLICSFTNPFTFFQPVSTPISLFYSCQPVPCFYVSDYILLIRFFCSLDSTHKWDHTVFVFHWLAYSTYYNSLSVHSGCLPKIRVSSFLLLAGISTFSIFYVY